MRRRLWIRPVSTRTVTIRPSAASHSILWHSQKCSQNSCSPVGTFSVCTQLLAYSLLLFISEMGLFLKLFYVVGAFHSPDQSGGHQQPSQQGPGFNRQPQSFYTSRGMSRGGPRNARGAINGYRGSSNGFRGISTDCHYNWVMFTIRSTTVWRINFINKKCKKINKHIDVIQILYKWNWEYLTDEFGIIFLLFSGGYDGYRPPFANTPNSGYGQNQFNTPRDYSNGNYQRVWKILSSL